MNTNKKTNIQLKQFIKKHTRLPIAVLCTFMATANLYAYEFKSGDLYYNIDPNVKIAIVTNSYNNPYSGAITIPESVTHNGETYPISKIEAMAFNNCPNLTSINVDTENKTFSSIDGILYSYNKETLIRVPQGTTKTITIPSNVSYIGSNAFNGCTSLENIDIPNSVIEISWGAFSHCTNLSSITLPNSITTITNNTFYNCSKLTSINIPVSITSIGNSAFAGCSGIKKIHVHNTTPSTLGTNVFNGISNCTLYLPINADISAYNNDSSWKDQFKNDFSNTILTENVFELTIGETEYASIYLPFNAKIPENITAYVATSTDYNCLHLKEVTDKILTKLQGYILKGKIGNYIINETQETPSVTSSVLTGTETETTSSTNCYVLGCESNTIGMYRYSGTKLGAYKAYLPANNKLSTARFLSFDFNGTTTDINSMIANSKTSTYFDLLGRRNTQPTHGVNIVNGKKVIK